MSRFLPSDPRVRGGLVGVATVALTLLVTQFVFAGGTPVGVLFDGFVAGMLTALTSAGIVLVYRTLRIINFAQTALGIFGATTLFLFVRLTEVPFPIAFLLGMAVSLLIGVATGIVGLRFAKSSRLVLTVATAVAAQFLVAFAPNIAELPFFSDIDRLPLQERSGGESITQYLPFPGFEFRVGSSALPFGFAHVFAIEMAVLALLALGAVLRYTRLGVAVRAMAENPERAALLGIGVSYLFIGVFGAAAVLGGLTAMGTAMVDRPASAGAFAPGVLLTALAGAVIARMERFPTAVLATILISVFMRAFRFAYPDDQGLVAVFLLVVLSVALLTQRRGIDRVEQASVSWAATDEPRRIPAVLEKLALIRNLRLALYTIGVVLLLMVPFVASTGFVNLASTIALSTIVVVSITVLTGWGGQVSLGQWGFAAIGAVVGGSLTATVGLPFWFAVPLAAGVTGAVAAAVGMPALRIRGLFLLVVTLAFAFAVQNVLFEERYFGWLLPDEGIERPTLFFLDFGDETSMYFLCVAALLGAVVMVGNLRRSRTGRILIALRENDINVQSFGVPIVRTKLLAFGISGSLAGFAGAIYAHQQTGLNAEAYGITKSIEAFTTAIIGGVASVAGALLGTLYFESVQYFSGSVLVQTFLANGGTLVIMFVVPGGFIAMAQLVRDSVLRIVAQRRQIVVPSLFADYDADSIEKQLVPLDELDTTAGLAALDPSQRWSMRSDLYRGRGTSAAERFAQAARTQEERGKAPAPQNPLLGGATR